MSEVTKEEILEKHLKQARENYSEFYSENCVEHARSINNYEWALNAMDEWAQGRIDEKAVLPEWISVEDRLPDVGEMVLVSVTNNKAFAGYYHERGHWIVIAINSSYKANEMHQVTHWMPKTILPPIK